LSPISTCKLFAVVMFCAPQLAIAFVWEHNDEKRGEWKKIVASAFLDECQSDPSESCLKASSLMQLTREVCGRVPPGVSAVDHRDIFREVCVNDVEQGVRTAIREINERRAKVAEVAHQNAVRERMEAELQERNARVEAENKRSEERWKKHEQEVSNRHLEIQKAREERKALIERVGLNGVLVDLFVALCLVLAFLIINYDVLLLKFRGVRNDQT